MFQLEKYRGTKSRYTCPACGCKNRFARYVNSDGNHLADDVGICDRVSKCGYHKPPKQFFAEQGITTQDFNPKRRSKGLYQARTFTEKPKSFDFIAPEHLTATLGNYDQNAFAQFLFNLFPDDAGAVQASLKMYFVGTYEDYTCLPSIDRLNNVCRAKLIRFDQVTGKRLKGDFDTSSLPAKLKLKEDFNYKQIFFGEHLLASDAVKSVGIVESEKTAIIASICLPQFIWLATGSKQWLKAERLQRLDNRQISLYPDADGFNQWQSIASDARRQRLEVTLSTLIEDFATDKQKENQYDLADYLIEQQMKINQMNELIDSYNSKLETILNDESLYADFETILDEQKAIAMICGGLSEEAETQLSCPDYYRKVVSSL